MQKRRRIPMLEDLEGRQLLAVFMANPVVSTTSPNHWAPLVGVSSYVKGATVEAIQAQGKETATWTWDGLAQGYYKVEMFYPQNANNAKKLTFQYKTTANTGFVTTTLKFDESQGGTPSTYQQRPINGFLPVYKNLTPFHFGIVNGLRVFYEPGRFRHRALHDRLARGPGGHRASDYPPLTP